MNNNFFENQTILITGGTGSFGNAFVDYLTKSQKFKKLIIYSRDEIKQWYMAEKYQNENRLRFFIGDVRDKERLDRALNGVDYVIHAAATKIVQTAEYNPFECVKTNVLGAMNIIEASINNNVKKVIALSTDKASSPFNLYGGSKLVSDKLFINGNFYSSLNKTIFSVVRYGNVLGSRGSVLLHIKKLMENGETTFPITDTEMTRFIIKLEDAIKLIIFAFKDMLGGELYVKKLPSIKIVDMVKSLIPKVSFQEVGIRPGEKLHEEMISSEDSKYTFEYDSYFKILPSIFNIYQDKKYIKRGKGVPKNFKYTSDTNKNFLFKKDFKKIYDEISNTL